MAWGATDGTNAWTERTVVAGGFSTRFIEAGAEGAPAMLLLHDGAWGGSSTVTWGNAIEFLAEDYHIYAPDLLGYGGTDKAVFVDRSPFESRMPHVAAFLQAVRIQEPIHVIGNSFGGGLALRALHNNRLPVSSVVSVGGAGGGWRPQFAVDELSRWDGTREDLSRVLLLLIDKYQDFDRQLDDRLSAATVPGHYRAVVAPSLPTPKPLRSHPADLWPAQIAGNRTPVLLIRGQRDVLLNPEWADHLHEALPNSEIVDVDARHSPNIDHAAAFVDTVRRFHGQL